MVRETPEIYKEIVLPYIQSIPPKRIQWHVSDPVPQLNFADFVPHRVYNILLHATESEKIVYEDPDPAVGFIVIPDFKWDLVTMSALYLVTIVHSKDIKSIRDLRKSHLGMLKKIRREAARACQEKWGIGRDGLKMFLHYQPSYCGCTSQRSSDGFLG